MRRLLIILAMLGFCAAPSEAKDVPTSALAASGAIADPPPQVRKLLDLMGDPQVRTWLDQRRGKDGDRVGDASPDTAQMHGDNEYLSLVMRHIGAIREHLAALFAAVPNMAGDFSRARIPSRASSRSKSCCAWCAC